MQILIHKCRQQQTKTRKQMQKRTQNVVIKHQWEGGGGGILRDRTPPSLRSFHFNQSPCL